MSSKKKISPKKFLMEQLEKETEGNVILVEDKDVKLLMGKDLTPTEKIVLREHQGPHVERLKMIFEKNHCAFDMSTMGAGKTYTTSKLSLDLGFQHVIVICPVSVESKWRGMTKYGVKLTHVLSYQGLRSVKNKNPKHGLLERIDVEDPESGINKTFFNSTEYLSKIVKEGLLFVIDEAQNIKNKNDQRAACQAIIKEIIRSESISRVLLLSGTPIDKEEHAVNILQAMWIIKSNILSKFIRDESRLILYGAQDLYEYCKLVDSKGTDKLIKENPWRADNVEHICYLMFQYIVKPKITSVMPSPPLEIDTKNGYYIIEPESDRKALIKAIGELHSSLMFSERDQTVNITQESIGAIAKALTKIEIAKVRSMARVAMETLESDHNCKVGIFVNYKESLNELEDILYKYKPLRLDGSVNKTKRPAIIEKFQEPNTKYRLIIANVQVASTGIDLDDKYGMFPRHAFASPNYKILDLHQLTRRFVRLDSKSNASFRFFYGGGISRKETSILNALARKTDVMKTTLEGQVEEGIIFPGDYEEEIEIRED